MKKTFLTTLAGIFLCLIFFTSLSSRPLHLKVNSKLNKAAGIIYVIDEEENLLRLIKARVETTCGKEDYLIMAVTDDTSKEEIEKALGNWATGVNMKLCEEEYTDWEFHWR